MWLWTRSSAIAATARVSVTSSVDGLTKYSPIYYIWGNRNRNLERDLLLVLIFISLTELSTHEILYTNMLYLLTRWTVSKADLINNVEPITMSYQLYYYYIHAIRLHNKRLGKWSRIFSRFFTTKPYSLRMSIQGTRSRSGVTVINVRWTSWAVARCRARCSVSLEFYWHSQSHSTSC